MPRKPLVDAHVLDGIPEDLIRPLLAISIQASRAYTLASIDHYKQVLKDLHRIGKVRQGEVQLQLYYAFLETKISGELQALIDAQKWAQKHDPEAHVTDIEVNRWLVHVRSQDQHRRLLVAYRTSGTTIHGAQIRAMITEADERDV